MRKVTMAYHNTKQDVIEMFTDRTAGESTQQNRLITRQGDNGVELIAYGWIKLAEYNEKYGVVTVYTGHRSMNSQAVNRYLNDVVKVATERDGRTVLPIGESPTVGQPNSGARFINHYVGDVAESLSPVEEDAVTEVLDSLKDLA